MFLPILRFEIAYQLRRPSTYLYLALIFATSFTYMTVNAIDLGRVAKNAPWMLGQMMLGLTAIWQIITAGLVGMSVLRDYTIKSNELYFTTSMSKVDYLAGRFVGAFVVMVIVYAAIPTGLFLGTLMPWVDPTKLVPSQASWYLWPFVSLALPNLLIVSALFFGISIATRAPFAVYTLGIFLLVADTVATELRDQLDNDTVTALTDVFGLSTYDVMTKYWTVVEKNSQMVPLAGHMLLNRLFWSAVALVLLGATVALFRFDVVPRSFRRKRAIEKAASVETAEWGQTSAALPVARQRFDLAARFGELLGVTRFTLRGIVRELPFLAICTIGMVDVFMSAWYSDQFYGTKVYPVTYNMAEAISHSLGLFFLILITVYAGELVWRERTLKADQIVDTLPVEAPVAILGRLLGLLASLAIVLAACMLTTMVVQAVKGYANFEPLLYLKFLYLTEFPNLIALVLLAFFVHTIINNKYAGHAVMLLMFVAVPLLTNLGFEHRLYQVGRTPAFQYSDMNQFGPYVPKITWYSAYWVAFGVLVLLIASIFWIRGTDTTLRHRLSTGSARFTRRMAVAVVASVVATALLGGAIYYRSNVLQTYEPSDDRLDRQAAYERTYKKYRALVQPRITDVSVRADLVPERLAFELAGSYTIVNTRNRPIDTLFVETMQASLEDGVAFDSLRLSRDATMLPQSDTAIGIRLYRLATPLAPGDTVRLGFGFHFVSRGFGNEGQHTAITYNGSFINSGYMPSLGYSEGAEITDPNDRKKKKLPVRERMHPITDSASWQDNEFTADADWVSFEARISTAPDQIALAPGYLQSESVENGRRVFQYRTEAKIAKFFSFLSARYSVKRDSWTGPNGQAVAIEIYYQPGHEYNLDRMILSVKRTLDYATAHFTPYQFRQVRILEFPRYSSFAQSFPNTIPYSEGIGFVTKVGTEDDDIDMPFFVTAHEVAHQWWGHQVIGANVQGSAIMVESLAEYTALMVMQKEHGQARSQKFLRHELDRYLRGRSVERIREQPLGLTEQQAYIHYNKGALAFYALADYIGEDKLNGALKEFLLDHHYPTAPYPTSRDLIKELRAATPDSLQGVITDLFDTITLFDNKTDSASWTKRADGKYVVTIAYDARKLRADSLGNENEIAISDWIDAGVFGAAEKGNKLGKPISVSKHKITSRKGTIEIVVDEQPVKAGIDPYNKLIDREPKDNVKDVGGRG